MYKRYKSENGQCKTICKCRILDESQFHEFAVRIGSCTCHGCAYFDGELDDNHIICNHVVIELSEALEAYNDRNKLKEGGEDENLTRS